MLFPVSGVEVNPLIPPLVALVVSTFTSMGGVSGAFLLLPFQVSALGFCTPAVSPTNLIFNIVAIPSGVYRYLRPVHAAFPEIAVYTAGNGHDVEDQVGGAHRGGAEADRKSVV